MRRISWGENSASFFSDIGSTIMVTLGIECTIVVNRFILRGAKSSRFSRSLVQEISLVMKGRGRCRRRTRAKAGVNSSPFIGKGVGRSAPKHRGMPRTRKYATALRASNKRGSVTVSGSCRHRLSRWVDPRKPLRRCRTPLKAPLRCRKTPKQDLIAPRGQLGRSLI